MTMTPEQYVKEALRTATGGVCHTELVSAQAFTTTIEAVVVEGKFVDLIKKALFYGRPHNSAYLTPSKEMGEPSLTTENLPDPDLLHAILGIVSEGLELLELLMDPGAITKKKIVDEGGDVLWYLALLSKAVDVPMSEFMSKNIDKLKARFPDQFDPDLAINKDVKIEQAFVDAQNNT